jgi:hypothetical protein
MDAKTTPDQIAEHRSWRRWAVGSLIVLLLGLMPIAGLHVYDASLVAEANHRIAELDRTEPGWREAKVDHDPLPPDHDSMVVLRRALALLPKKWADDVGNPPDSMLLANPSPCLLPKRDEKDIGDALTRAAAALTVAQTLKDFPEGRFTPKRSADGKSWNYSEEYQVREVSQLLEYAIYDALQRREIGPAWEMCRAQVNVGKPIRDGDSVGGLVRNACASIATKNVERVLAHGVVEEADLAVMQKTIAEEAEFDFYFPFLPHECDAWLRGLDDMLANRSEFDRVNKMFPHKADEIGWWGQLNERYPRFMLLKTKIVSVERIAATRRLKPLHGFARAEAFERLDREFGLAAKDGTQRYVWISNVQLAHVKSERGIRAYLGCAQVALAAERHRLKFGHWPATAGELVDKGLLARVPEDPFDGNPLRMRHFAEGLVVYAVGKRKDYDGTDWDDFNDLESRFREGTEFRLWNSDRRHQPAIPPRKIDDEEELPPPIRVAPE